MPASDAFGSATDTGVSVVAGGSPTGCVRSQPSFWKSEISTTWWRGRSDASMSDAAALSATP